MKDTILNNRAYKFDGMNIKFSVPRDFENFNLGIGLDDDAISITLLSNEKEQIVLVLPETYNCCLIITNKNLWKLTGHTPSNLYIKKIESIHKIIKEHESQSTRVEKLESLLSDVLSCKGIRSCEDPETIELLSEINNIIDIHTDKGE